MGAAAPAVEICKYPNIPERFEALVLPVDKPAGWSSFRVVKKLRWLTKVRKIGHAGTLDPMATGLLVCLIGKPATRQMESYMGLQKEYVGTIRLGETTPSYDAETEVTERRTIDHLTDQDILKAAGSFLGETEQVPPMYSALKVGGERLYKKARRGESVERKARRVVISSFDLEPLNGRDVNFRITCSKGTYIRCIAHDLGNLLGVGGHLVSLRRTKIGDISIADAWAIDELESAILKMQSGKTIGPEPGDQHLKDSI